MIKILFIGYGILGDHIICFRSAEMLKKKYPNSHLTFVGNPVFSEIGLQFGNNIIDEIIDIEYGELNEYAISPDYQSLFWDKIFNQSNIIINHKMDNDGYFARNLISKGFWWVRNKEPGIKIDTTSKILLQDKVKDESRNAYAQVGELVELIGCSTNNWQTSLNVNQKTKKEVLKKAGNYFNVSVKFIIAFHPGSSTKNKNYPLAKWAKVISELLKETGVKLLIFIGPNEEKELSEIKNIFTEENTMIIQKPLTESTAWLSVCNLFLGHDTGFAHISASLKLPSVLLFGSASLKIWKPPISSTRVLYSKNLSKLEPYKITNFINNETTL